MGCGASAQSVQKAHKSTHSIATVTITGGKTTCSGTAVGPHALLTASHCEAPSDELFLDDAIKPVHILRIIRDDLDHSIFIVDKPFEDYVSISERKLEQGEQVFLFGNPGPFSDVYREGYFAGYAKYRYAPVQLFDVNTFHGDSGAGIFDKSGKLVAVMTGRFTLGESTDIAHFANGFPLIFSAAQLAAIR